MRPPTAVQIAEIPSTNPEVVQAGDTAPPPLTSARAEKKRGRSRPLLPGTLASQLGDDEVAEVA